jgi:hypothetical protein
MAVTNQPDLLSSLRTAWQADIKDALSTTAADAIRAGVRDAVVLLGQQARTPNITVAAPHLALSPNIAVEQPKVSVEVEAPEVELTMNFDGMNARLAAIEQTLIALLTVMKQPVTKTVERGAGNWIQTVTETRG